jgi:hypothetical protein
VPHLVNYLLGDTNLSIVKFTQQTQTHQDVKDVSLPYLQMRREWLEHQQVGTGGQNDTGSGPSVMQRWHQESMRDQPYNNVGAVRSQEQGARHGQS